MSDPASDSDLAERPDTLGRSSTSPDCAPSHTPNDDIRQRRSNCACVRLRGGTARWRHGAGQCPVTIATAGGGGESTSRQSRSG